MKRLCTGEEIFKVSSEKGRKAFVQELSHLFQAYADASTLKGVALKPAMVMPALLLQRPHSISKAKEHTQYLQHHLRQWLKGNLKA